MRRLPSLELIESFTSPERMMKIAGDGACSPNRMAAWLIRGGKLQCLYIKQCRWRQLPEEFTDPCNLALGTTH